LLAAPFSLPAIGLFTVAARMEFEQPVPSAAPFFRHPTVLI
jgi:hypothetical protein